MRELVAEMDGLRVVNHFRTLDEDQADPVTVPLPEDGEASNAILRPIPEGKLTVRPRALNTRFVTFPDLGELAAVGDPCDLNEH
jgi:hypothetical protein